MLWKNILTEREDQEEEIVSSFKINQQCQNDIINEIIYTSIYEYQWYHAIYLNYEIISGFKLQQ